MKSFQVRRNSFVLCEGSRFLFFYSLLWVRSGGVEGGSFDGLASVNDGDKQIPLSIILAKDSTGEMASEGEKTMAGEGVGVSLRSCYRIWKGKAIDEMITVW